MTWALVHDAQPQKSCGVASSVSTACGTFASSASVFEAGLAASGWADLAAEGCGWSGLVAGAGAGALSGFAAAGSVAGETAAGPPVSIGTAPSMLRNHWLVA